MGRGLGLRVLAARACQTFSCNTASGAIETTNVTDGTACNDDGDVCNGVTSCVAGSCVETTVDVTVPADTECTTYSCDAASGLVTTFADVGTACANDGDACNGVSSCDSTGSCVETASAVTVPAATACQTFSCNTASGAIEPTNVTDGTACNDYGEFF